MKRLVQGFTLLAAGIGSVSSVGCGVLLPYSVSCDIAIKSVAVSADFSVHQYSYDFSCDRNGYDGQVQGSTDLKSGQTKESVTRGAASMLSSGICAQDPWTATTSEGICHDMLISVNTTGDVPPLPYDQAGNLSNMPGAFYLAPEHRDQLRAALDTAVADMKAKNNRPQLGDQLPLPSGATQAAIVCGAVSLEFAGKVVEPAANQQITYPAAVTINVQRAVTPCPGGTNFDLQWQYLDGATWTDVDILPSIDSAVDAARRAIPQETFWPYENSTTSDRFRVRARLHGNANAPWTDWTEFTLLGA